MFQTHDSLRILTTDQTSGSCEDATAADEAGFIQSCNHIRKLKNEGFNLPTAATAHVGYPDRGPMQSINTATTRYVLCWVSRK